MRNGYLIADAGRRDHAGGGKKKGKVNSSLWTEVETGKTDSVAPDDKKKHPAVLRVGKLR